MDDLFGDLPAAKNSAPSGNETPFSPTPSQPATAAAPPKPDDVPPKPTLSLVTALGTAGTSMAFVPQALRKKKKQAAPQPKEKPREEKRSRVDVSLPGDSQHDSGNVDKVATPDNVNSIPTDQIAIPINVDESNNSRDINNDSANENTGDDDSNNSEPYLENEPPSLRQLHDLAKTSLTPYNPHTPNDYLAYRERRKTAAVRKDMQAAALAKLEAHDRLRKKVEEERRRIELSGDVDKIVESRLGGVVGEAGAGRGRGRGRGMSNLPAWLVKKQQEKELGAAEKKEDGQFDDAPDNHEKARTISLLNMVAPGRVDNELSFEVREECGRYGKVLNVDIIDAHPNQEHVRVDVTFENKESAMEAIKMFDRRMFGDRQIIAKMCDER
ncbi:hypothetical protein HJC23_013983 [Cyclotella cryptica]|uniref:RRM domain-containing protein n=1 Tax=Cyclotella cryptica TaxID=29204 RepID=A0ABD3NW95_9STRA|eukprot:CCRYP_019235-RA/>CCRYP_019235-RA protein AED:0.00 eAED:0.00 QI:88/-1/1/1/-1/1/1/198/383